MRKGVKFAIAVNAACLIFMIALFVTYRQSRKDLHEWAYGLKNIHATQILISGKANIYIDDPALISRFMQMPKSLGDANISYDGKTASYSLTIRAKRQSYNLSMRMAENGTYCCFYPMYENDLEVTVPMIADFISEKEKELYTKLADWSWTRDEEYHY